MENRVNDKEFLKKQFEEEGKTVEEIKASLSPKWQKSKYIDQIDNYYGSKKEQKARFNRINKLMSVAGKLDVMMGHDKYGVEWLYELPTKSLTILHEENIEFSEFGRTKSAMTLRLDIKDKINKLASDELEK